MNQQQNLDIQTQKTDIYSWSKAHVIHHERSNRVGGKRSSFLPTFVFRPLTPPYVRFSYTAVP